jgi:hypothetical protein
MADQTDRFHPDKDRLEKEKRDPFTEIPPEGGDAKGQMKRPSSVGDERTQIQDNHRRNRSTE